MIAVWLYQYAGVLARSDSRTVEELTLEGWEVAGEVTEWGSVLMRIAVEPDEQETARD